MMNIDQGLASVWRALSSTKSLARQVIGVLLALALLPCQSVHAFRFFDVGGFDLGIARWDAAPHFVDGVERSLDGGLRYSVSGGSYEAFRDALSWEGAPPSVPDFRRAVEQAFAAWEAIDPATGLRTKLRFVPDFDTPVFAEPIPPDETGLFRLNHGAEIDLLTEQHPSGTQAAVELFGDPNANSVALTSGVSNYAAGVISGADIYMSDSQLWTSIQHFQNGLTHEIGHAIGLGDVDWYQGAHGGVLSRFYDDNYDNTSPATALDTLTNSFAGLIDPLDPDNSQALMPYDICTPTAPNDDPNDPLSCVGNPGIDTPGVDILMESTPTRLPLPSGPQNDDFAGRQFLYPFVLVGDAHDCNGDGVVDIDDTLCSTVDTIADTLAAANLIQGDADGNGKVEFADFVTLSSNFGQDGNYQQGNFDLIAGVEFDDFLILSGNFGQTAGVAAAVPESAGSVLALFGVLFLAWTRRGFHDRKSPATTLQQTPSLRGTCDDQQH